MSKEPWRGSTWHTDCEMIKQQQANNMEDPPNSQLRVGQSHRPGMEEPLVGRRRWQKQLEEDALTGSCSSSRTPTTSTTAASSSSCTLRRGQGATQGSNKEPFFSQAQEEVQASIRRDLGAEEERGRGS